MIRAAGAAQTHTGAHTTLFLYVRQQLCQVGKRQQLRSEAWLVSAGQRKSLKKPERSAKLFIIRLFLYSSSLNLRVLLKLAAVWPGSHTVGCWLAIANKHRRMWIFALFCWVLKAICVVKHQHVNRLVSVVTAELCTLPSFCCVFPARFWHNSGKLKQNWWDGPKYNRSPPP